MKQETRIIPTCCNACGGQTGVLAHVVDGKVVKLEPNAENPIGVANKGTNLNIFYEGRAEALSGQALIKEARVRVTKTEVHRHGPDNF